MFRSRSVLLALAVVMVPAGCLTAQQTNQEFLKEYAEAFIGTWETSWKMDTNYKDIVKEGDEVSLRLTFKWTLNNQAIDVHWDAKINGNPAGTGKGMVGWDRASDEIVSFGFNTFGGRALSEIRKHDDHWIQTTTSVGLEGFRSASTTKMTFASDGDSYVELLNGRMTQDNQPLPNMEITYKRVKE